MLWREHPHMKHFRMPARLPARLATAGVATALAAGAVVATAPAQAAVKTVTQSYTCSVPGIYSGDFPLTVTGGLPVDSYAAGAPVGPGLLGVEVSTTLPQEAVGLLSIYDVDGANSEDFGFGVADAFAPVPISGAFSKAADGTTTWSATGANEAFTTPGAGQHQILLPEHFALTPTSKGEALPLDLDCVAATAPASIGQVALAQQDTEMSAPKKVAVKKGKRGKVKVSVSQGLGSPAGKVVAKEGKKSLGSGTLKSGTAVVKLAKLKPGKHKVVLSYAGSDSSAASSTKVTVKVAKK